MINYSLLKTSKLDVVDDHGGFVSLPCALPLATSVPEILRCLRRVVLPGFGGAVCALHAFREKPVGTSHSYVEDCIKLLVEWSHVVASPDVAAAKSSPLPETSLWGYRINQLVVYVGVDMFACPVQSPCVEIVRPGTWVHFLVPGGEAVFVDVPSSSPVKCAAHGVDTEVSWVTSRFHDVDLSGS